MAAHEPAKAPPLYEPARAKSTARPAGLAFALSRVTLLRMKALAGLALMALVAACDGAPEITFTDKIAEARPAPAKAFAYEEKTGLIEFEYGWSAEAAAVPELVRKFRANLYKSKADLIAGAQEKDSDFNPFMLSTHYRTAGQTPRLLSLAVESGSYTGGAHGNYRVGALLWDRAARKEVRFQDLFPKVEDRDFFLRNAWCNALRAARREKRGKLGSGGPFDLCPSLNAITILPSDRDNDGRFDRLMLVASPYVAGPWVEGAYEIDLAVSSYLIAALKREYQSSFEV